MESRLNQPSNNSSGPRLPPHISQPQWVNYRSSPSVTRAQQPDRQLDETTLAQRTTALRQLNRVPQSRQRRYRRSIDNRPNLPSQPVVVRTYSPEIDARLAMSRSSHSENRPPARLPPVQDFGIEGILRAIEPDIQSTLDAIAEICGRSKLSLANEYGSHRPPLGEIRAPTRLGERELLTVEEASSSTERLADENVVIVGDDTSMVDGHEQYPSMYGFSRSIHSNSNLGGYRTSTGRAWTDTNFERSSTANESSRPEASSQAPAQTRNSRDRPMSFPWALVKKGTDSGDKGNVQSILTQPVVSEVHLDVQADGTYQADSEPSWPAYEPFPELPPDSEEELEVERTLLNVASERLSFLSDLQGLLSRFRRLHQCPESADSQGCISAERRLREVLQRQSVHLMSENESRPTVQAEAG